MAVADGDRGAELKLCAALFSLSLAACASTTDTADHGHQIVETTIEVINDDPLEWGGKWVRLEGLVDSDSTLLVTSRERRDIGINLNPRDHMQDGGWVAGLDEPDRRVSVVGRVDLSCVNWFKQAVPGITYADIRDVTFDMLAYAPPTRGPLGHCAFVVGPYLTDAVITKTETDQ